MPSALSVGNGPSSTSVGNASGANNASSISMGNLPTQAASALGRSSSSNTGSNILKSGGKKRTSSGTRRNQSYGGKTGSLSEAKDLYQHSSLNNSAQLSRSKQAASKTGNDNALLLAD